MHVHSSSRLQHKSFDKRTECAGGLDMSCNTDLIICLWLAPVVAFFLLPLAVAVVGLPLMAIRRVLFSAAAADNVETAQQHLGSSEDTVALPDGATA